MRPINLLTIMHPIPVPQSQFQATALLAAKSQHIRNIRHPNAHLGPISLQQLFPQQESPLTLLLVPCLSSLHSVPSQHSCTYNNRGWQY